MTAKSKVDLYGFNRGLISEEAMARFDTPRLRLSAAIQDNWIPSEMGSMSLRPGLGFIGESVRSVLLPFIFATRDAAVLEFGDNQIRIWQNDELLSFEEVDTVVVNGDLDPDLSGWTEQDDPGATSQYAATVQPTDLVVIANHAIVDEGDSDLGPGNIPRSTYTLNSNGVAYSRRAVEDSNVDQVISGEWLLAGSSADYEVMATLNSGTVGGGSSAFNTWLNLGTSRAWVCTAGNVAEIGVIIRHAPSLNPVGTATITLEATEL